MEQYTRKILLLLPLLFLLVSCDRGPQQQKQKKNEEVKEVKIPEKKAPEQEVEAETPEKKTPEQEVKKLRRYIDSAEYAKLKDELRQLTRIPGYILGALAAGQGGGGVVPGIEPDDPQKEFKKLSIPIVSTEALILALSEKEGKSVRMLALALLAMEENNLEATIPTLTKLLHEKDTDISKGALAVLSKIGTPQARQTILPLLKDENPEIRLHCIEVVGKSKGDFPFIISALVEILQDENVSMRKAAIEALGNLKSNPEQIIPLLSPFLQDRDPDVQRVTVRALGQFTQNPEQVISILTPLLQDRNFQAREEILEALEQFSQHVKQIIPILTLLLKKEENQAVLRGAVIAIGKFSSDPQLIVPPLIKALELRDAYVTSPAAEILGKLKGKAKEAIPALIQSMKVTSHVDPHNALLQIGPEAVPFLIQALNDQDWIFRREIVQLLGEFGDKRAIPALIQALNDNENYVRGQAARALGKIKSLEAIPKLISLLRCGDDHVQSRAGEALEELGPLAIPELIKTLESGDQRLCRSIIRLSNMKSEKAAPALKKIILNQDNDPDIIFSAIETLAKLDLPHQELVSLLIEVLQRDEETHCRIAAEILGKIKAKEAIPYLAKLLQTKELRHTYIKYDGSRHKELKGPDAYTYEVFVQALGELGPEAVPELLPVLKSTNRDIRLQAIRTLGKMESQAVAATSALRENLQDKDREVVMATIEALGKIKAEDKDK